MCIKDSRTWNADTETIDHLTVALDETYKSQVEYSESEQLCELVFKLINGYIDYLDRQRGK